MHWHAIAILEQATKDMIGDSGPLLRCYVQFGCVMVCVTTLHLYTDLQQRTSFVLLRTLVKWSVAVDA